jgi:hypothetical protein
MQTSFDNGLQLPCPCQERPFAVSYLAPKQILQVEGLAGGRPYLPDNHETAPLGGTCGARQGRARARWAYRGYEQQQVGKRQVGKDPPRANQPLQVLDHWPGYVGSVPDKLGQCCHRSSPIVVDACYY